MTYDVTYAQAVATLAGLGMGGTLDIFLGTQTEVQKRGFETKQFNLVKPIPMVPGIRGVLYGLGSGLVVAVLAVLVSLGILWIGGVHELLPALRLPFFMGLIVGAGVAKFLRYFYWRSR